jgi:hypothetical protein
MSAITFLWILELFPRMVCHNLRELTVTEIRPDGTDIVALVHRCQKYAPNFDVYSWRAPSFQPCTAYEFMHPSTTQWPYWAPARWPSKATMAVVVVDNVFSRRYCCCCYLWLGRNRLCTHDTWEVPSLPWVVSKNSPNPYFIHPPMVNAACKSLLTNLNDLVSPVRFLNPALDCLPPAVERI